MDTSIRISKILSQISSLDYETKIQVAEKILQMIRKKEVKKEEIKLSDLKGLGTEIWQNMDIDSYINSERQWD